MSFWELRVPACLDTAEGVTNLLWEQGALGVVEEEQPGTPARLRAFYPDTTSSTDLLGAVNAYRGAPSPDQPAAAAGKARAASVAACVPASRLTRSTSS